MIQTEIHNPYGRGFITAVINPDEVVAFIPSIGFLTMRDGSHFQISQEYRTRFGSELLKAGRQLMGEKDSAL